MLLSDANKRRSLCLTALMMLGLPLAGCFAPVYGERARGGGGAQVEMARVAVEPTSGRHNILLRNELIFGLTGGAGSAQDPLYILNFSTSTTTTPTLIDSISGPQTSYQIVFNGSYTLREKTGGKILTTGFATGGASVALPSQNYAGDRGAIDAYDRAAKVVADQIVTQLSTYFATRNR